MTTQNFRRLVWQHYKKHGRHDLPWRLNVDPYAIVVSEVMLQQTQVERVIPKFNAWLSTFPTWMALAQAPVADVLRLWQGLGYNRRALNLQRCAAAVAAEHAGVLPRDEEALRALPGIGPYTAAAVQAFAFNVPVVMIETNIRGVFLHHWFADQTNIADMQLLPVVEKTVDTKKPREWYWALMDYGSYLKKTVGNPSRRSQHHVQQSAFEGSGRQVRGAIIRVLTIKPVVSEKVLHRLLAKEGIVAERVPVALTQLEHEGFIMRDQKRKTLRLFTKNQP
jgi:A/G-specific adenine glycosylase